jgi:hypothetical protein
MRYRVVLSALIMRSCGCAVIDVIFQAMGRAIELGIEGPEVEAAKSMRTRLDEEKEMAGAGIPPH